MTTWKRRGDTWQTDHQFGLDPLFGAFLSPDAEHLFVPSWPNRLRTFRLSDGAIVNHLDARYGRVSSVCFSPSGKQFATCAESLRVWDYPSQIQQSSFLSSAGVWDAAWSPSEDSIATTGADGVVRIWDLRLGQSSIQLVPPQGLGSMHAIAYLRDGEHLSGVGREQSTTWNLKTMQIVPTEQVSGDKLKSVHSSAVPFGEHLALQFALLPQWDPRACSLGQSLFEYRSNAPQVQQARVIAGGSTIVEVGAGRLREWSTDPMKLRIEKHIEKLDSLPVVFDISPDGRTICGARTDGGVVIFDLKRWTSVTLEAAANVRGATFLPNSDRILICDDKGIREFDTRTGTQQRVLVDEAQEHPASIASDGRRFARAVGADIAICDTATGEETMRLENVQGFTQFLFAPNGTSFVAKDASSGHLYYWPGSP